MKDYTKYLLVPFEHQGRTYNGADCFGLLRLFYRDELGIDLKDFAEDYPLHWWERATYFLSLYEEYGFEPTDTPKYGDVVAFKNNLHTLGHCGVVLEDGMFLHMTTGGAAISSSLRGTYAKSICGAYTYRGQHDCTRI